MTDARQTPDPDEKALLAHFRQHQGGTPPDHLDAFILATARREVPKMRPSLWRRWLQACQRPRWQVAFASLASIALMLTVFTRESQIVSEQDFAPTMALPAPAMMKRKAEGLPPAAGEMQSAPVVSAPPATFSESPHIERSAPKASQDRESVNVRKRIAPSEDGLNKGLHEILRMQRAGQEEAAQEKRATLQRLFPMEDLESRLTALKASEP